METRPEKLEFDIQPRRQVHLLVLPYPNGYIQQLKSPDVWSILINHLTFLRLRTDLQKAKPEFSDLLVGVCADCKHLEVLHTELYPLPTIKAVRTTHLKNLRVTFTNDSDSSLENVRKLIHVATEVRLACCDVQTFDFSSDVFNCLELYDSTLTPDMLLTLPVTVKTLKMWRCQATNIETRAFETFRPSVRSLSIANSDMSILKVLNLTDCRSLHIMPLEPYNLCREDIRQLMKVVCATVYLQKLHFNFRNVQKLEHFDGLIDCISHLRSLKNLKLDFGPKVLIKRKTLRLLQGLPNARFLEIVSIQN